MQARPVIRAICLPTKFQCLYLPPPTSRCRHGITLDASRMVSCCGTNSDVKRKHQKTLELIFRRPVSGNVKWVDIKGLLKELGAELEEREGSRVVVFLFGEVRVYHRPHPSPSTDKGAVASVRDWLKANGVTP